MLQGDYVGIFDIVTTPPLRGRGLGRDLVLHLLSWAQAQGARRSYLQVTLSNTPAPRLYGGLGFREAYQYWYRVKAHRPESNLTGARHATPASEFAG